MKASDAMKYAVFVTGSGLIYLSAVSFMAIPKENMDLVKYIVPFMCGSVVGTGVGWALGTSFSSSKKDDRLFRGGE